MARLFAKLGLTGLLLAFTASALAQVHVRGYYRKNGTYVAPHYRSSPNHSRLDNWSTRGNIHPYTGQPGTRNPYPEPRTYTSPTYYPRTYAAPAYRPAPYPRPYSYPSTAYRSYSGPSSLGPRVSQPEPVDPEVLRWYRCDDGNGEYHYSHNPAPRCVFSGASRRGS